MYTRARKSFLSLLLAAVVMFGAGTRDAKALIIAVLDTGVNPVDVLDGNIVEGLNTLTGTTNTLDDGIPPHGTIVSLIALRTVGIAQIMPIKVLGGSGGGSIAGINAGMKLAAENPNVRVVNMSLGSELEGVDTYIEGMTTLANAGKIIIAAAGNEGASEPAFPAKHIPNLGGVGIAVGAVDENNVLASYSNRAGTNAMNHFMVANGVFEGFRDGSYAGAEGTSFAAPRVAGAAALILNHSPFLTASQVVDILLSTATDLGAPGVDATYGHGLLNIQAALAPVGGISSPTGRATSGDSVPVVPAALLLGAASYAVLSRSKNAPKTLVLDQYERPYTVDLTNAATIRDDTPGLASLMNGFRYQNAWLELPVGNNSRIALYTVADTATPSVASDADYFTLREETESRRPELALSLHGQVGVRTDYRLDINQDPRRAYGALGIQSTNAPVQFLSQRSMTAPYMGFSDRADSVQLGYRMNDRTQLRMGVASMHENGEFGLQSNAAVIEGSYQASDKLELSMQFGQLAEQGSLFGGANGGVFGVDNSQTTAIGVSGRYRVTPNLALFGSYTEGYTRVADRPNSLVHNFSTVRSRAWGLGMSADNLVQRGDRLGFAVSRPLRATGGNVDLTLPLERDYYGNITSATERLSLVPDGNELDLEASYQWRVGRDTHLATYLLYQKEPQHLIDANDRMTLLGIIQRQF